MIRVRVNNIDSVLDKGWSRENILIAAKDGKIVMWQVHDNVGLVQTASGEVLEEGKVILAYKQLSESVGGTDQPVLLEQKSDELCNITVGDKTIILGVISDARLDEAYKLYDKFGNLYNVFDRCITLKLDDIKSILLNTKHAVANGNGSETYFKYILWNDDEFVGTDGYRLGLWKSGIKNPAGKKILLEVELLQRMKRTKVSEFKVYVDDNFLYFIFDQGIFYQALRDGSSYPDYQLITSEQSVTGFSVKKEDILKFIAEKLLKSLEVSRVDVGLSGNRLAIKLVANGEVVSSGEINLIDAKDGIHSFSINPFFLNDALRSLNGVDIVDIEQFKGKAFIKLTAKGITSKCQVIALINPN